MNASQLSAIDLNLLVALEALLEESSVGQAASRVGLSQSAMSHALGRLRVLFDDQILVRSSGSMHATARAEAVRIPLGHCLEQVRRIVFEGLRFDPATSSRRFRIATEDYFSGVLLAEFIAVVRAEAPGLDIELVRSGLDPIRQLSSHDADLLIGVFGADTGMRREVLFSDDHACLLRSDHPDVGRRLSLKVYAATPHVVVSVGARRPTRVDELLAKRGLKRRVALRVDNFLAAPIAVAASDLLFTCPLRLAAAPLLGGVRRVRAPLELGSFEYAMLWPEWREEDPAHAWLRSVLGRVARPKKPSTQPR